ncbi:hypothetical protein ACN9M0_35430 [Streptomyces sp. R-07]
MGRAVLILARLGLVVIDRVLTGRIDPGKVFDRTLPLAQIAAV